jgi:hypothetical protein
MAPMAKEVVLVLVRDPGDMLISLDLGSRRGKEINIHGISVVAAAERTEMGTNMRATRGLYGKGMRR